MNALKQIELGAYCRILDMSDGAIMVGIKRDPQNPDNIDLVTHTHGLETAEVMGVIELLMNLVNKKLEMQNMAPVYPDCKSHLIRYYSHDSHSEAD